MGVCLTLSKAANKPMHIYLEAAKHEDMDVTLTWDTVFGILDAARKYMVEDCVLTPYDLSSRT